MKVTIYTLLFGVMILGRGLCPDDCICFLDEKGRREILCSRGGMQDPIPIESMDHNVEVLKISAPVDSPNMLTIGPIFQAFSHLEELHITRSNIPAIGKHSFWGVPTLLILNLTQNNVSHILDHNFRGLVNLIKLHLDDNRIESMPSETFKHLQELKILTLARNKIHELVPRIFLKLGKLKELDLSHNPLTELNPEVFKDIQGLKVFKCRSCVLSNINTLIYRLLVDLEELDLGNNEFKYILSDEFRFLKKLQILQLEGNQLAVILDNTFGNVHKSGTGLREVSVSRNRLAKVTTNAFANLTTLKILDLSYNKLDKLEVGTFQTLSESLWTLNLSGNAFAVENLKFVIQMVPKLRHLSMADMGLSNLPQGLFAHHEHLKFLNLSGNYFSRLSSQFLISVSQIVTLDLSKNKIRGLSEKIVMRLQKIQNLILTDNPWACDLCHIPPILNRINDSKMSFALRDLTCKSPYGLAGRIVSSLQGDELKWCTFGESSSEEENISAVGIPRRFLPSEAQVRLILGIVAVALFVITIVGVATCFIYSRHRTNHYYTREEERTHPNSFLESSSLNHCENGKGVYNISVEIPKIKNKKISISTVSQLIKYPELHVLPNSF